MKRREFLKSTAIAAGAAAATSAAAPLLLGAEDKSGSKNVVIGAGDHKYEACHVATKASCCLHARRHIARAILQGQ